MKHKFGNPKLGMSSLRRMSILRNLSISLVNSGRVKTTLHRAKSLRPFLEKLVTKSSTSSLSCRRLLLSRLRNKEAVSKLISEIGPKYAQRQGGYTRILKIGNRIGDNAPMALIEFV